MSQFYERYVRPAVMEPGGAAERNLYEYGQTIKYWHDLTGDPPLKEIDEWVCAEFLKRLKRLPGREGHEVLSVNTVRKHCVHLQHVLDLAGPKDRRHPMAKRLLDESPYLQRPAAWLDEVEDVFEGHEVEAWKRACRFATTPRIDGVAASAWWLGLIVYIYNVGIRIGSALAIRYAWHSTDPEGRHWLKIPYGAIKGHKALKLYVSAEAWEAIQAIRTDRELVFPWPHCRRHLDTIREQLLEKAGIPADRQFGFHGLRKALASDLAEGNPIAAQKQLGHAAMTMTSGHYVPPRATAGAIEEVAAKRRTKARQTADPRQKLLF
ncbi:MAG: tyrosine-type recombinase/integrase [Phycisphaerae bacterium]|nr:tyrosine-type recombinase/integrase [Phycisphaerae bacterium]